ncbi:MAG: GntR family transcriptional regulator [Lachnospiraceae bacterium]|jgi:GntR family transcriptional regulator|nr:GntR family transcriptional regulator [Lachnospiraceae bacterium]
MNILIDQLSQTPIYEQIESQIRQNILSGKLEANYMMPSIRKMAKELGVGIITVKRAYDDMCNEGLLISLQGRGVFVADIDMDKEKEVRFNGLREKLLDVKAYCDTSDISKEELIKEIEKMYGEK